MSDDLWQQDTSGYGLNAYDAEAAEARKQIIEEAKRRAAEKEEAERRAAEKQEAERRAAEKAEAERRAAEKAAAERRAAEREEAKRLEAEREEAKKRAVEKEKASAIKAARTKQEFFTGIQQRIAQQKLAAIEEERENKAKQELARKLELKNTVKWEKQTSLSILRRTYEFDGDTEISVRTLFNFNACRMEMTKETPGNAALAIVPFSQFDSFDEISAAHNILAQENSELKLLEDYLPKHIGFKDSSRKPRSVRPPSV